MPYRSKASASDVLVVVSLFLGGMLTGAALVASAIVI